MSSDIGKLFITQRIEFQQQLIRMNAWQTCLSCTHWQGNEGLPTGCTKFQALPPPEVIVVGCTEHIADIPF